MSMSPCSIHPSVCPSLRNLPLAEHLHDHLVVRGSSWRALHHAAHGLRRRTVFAPRPYILHAGPALLSAR
jgi:hypothetical protein